VSFMRRFKGLTANNLGRQIVRRMTARRPVAMLRRRPMVTTYRGVGQPLVWSFRHRAIGQGRGSRVPELAEESRIPGQVPSPGLQTLQHVRSAVAGRPPARPKRSPEPPSAGRRDDHSQSGPRTAGPPSSEAPQALPHRPADRPPTARRPMRRTAVEITPRTEELLKQAVSDESVTKRPEAGADDPVQPHPAADQHVSVPETPPGERETTGDERIGTSEVDDAPTVVLVDRPPDLRRLRSTEAEPDGVVAPSVQTEKEEQEEEQPVVKPVAAEPSAALRRPEQTEPAKTVIARRTDEAGEQLTPTRPSEDSPAPGSAPGVSGAKEAARDRSGETTEARHRHPDESHGMEPALAVTESMPRQEPEPAPDVSPPTSKGATEQPIARERSKPAARPPVGSPEPASVRVEEVGDTAPVVDEEGWRPETRASESSERAETAPHAASDRPPRDRATSTPELEAAVVRQPWKPTTQLPLARMDSTAVPLASRRPAHRRLPGRARIQDRASGAPLQRKHQLPVTTPTLAPTAAPISTPRPVGAQRREMAKLRFRRAEKPSPKERPVTEAPAIGSSARRPAAGVKPILPVPHQGRAQPMPLVGVFDGGRVQRTMPDEQRTGDELEQSEARPAASRSPAEPKLSELVTAVPAMSSRAPGVQRSPEEGSAAEAPTPTAGSSTAAGEGAAEASEAKVDMDAVAQQVYEILRRRLRVELERSRGSLLV
jgi:hypothetical protein